MIKDLEKLAHAHPKTRKHLVPLIRKYANPCLQVTGPKRDLYIDHVWDMFVSTYRKIGLILSNPQEMYKYPIWDICLGSDGAPNSFTLYKKTALGLKLGLMGSNGSTQGKHTVVQVFRTKLLLPGYYAEVSHAMESIAVTSGVPAVCAMYAPKILGKSVIPSADGVHYTRSLKGVGVAEKLLVGRPKGIPVTDPKQPSCTTGAVALNLPSEEADDAFDVLMHHACMILD